MPYIDDILPVLGHDGRVLQNVAFVVLDRFPSFEFGVVCEVFGTDRRGDGLPAYDFAVVAGEDGPLHSEHGLTLAAAYGMERLAEADLVVVSAIDEQLREGVPREFPAPLLRELRGAVARGAQVLSVCTGAFVLAAAGLLDGRRCTTHWRYAADLARYCPAATVDPDVLYVDAHPVVTSAGSAAGIDACLYVVRKEQGAKVANQIARRMVVAPHRDGGQAQFVDRPLPAEPADTLAEVTGWLERHLDQQVTVAELASLAHMSPRTFARRFVQETGTTPLRWLTGQRILLAQRLLEDTDETVDLVAERAGFGNAMALRHHFRAWRGTTPAAYRGAFRASETVLAGGSDPPGTPRGPARLPTPPSRARPASRQALSRASRRPARTA
jgi:transcriptional regulator GlxA family with amidase domain